MIDEMLQKTKYRKEIMILMPAIAALVLGNMFVIQPSIKKMKALDQDRQALSRKEANYQNILDNEKRVGGFSQKFAARSEKDWMVEKFSAFAQEEGLSVLSVASEDTKKMGDYFDVTLVRMDAEGKTHAFGEFLSKVESMEQLVKVSAVEMVPYTVASDPLAQKDVGAKDGVLKIVLSLAIFNSAEVQR